MNTKRYSCREISRGLAQGEVLRSSDPILFYHTDPETGVVTERGHCLEGVSVRGKLLVFPGGKGSSVVQMDGLYKLQLHGNAPLGFLVETPDTVLVSSAIIMELPMADRISPDFYAEVRTGDRISIDTEHETIELIQKG